MSSRWPCPWATTRAPCSLSVRAYSTPAAPPGQDAKPGGGPMSCRPTSRRLRLSIRRGMLVSSSSSETGAPSPRRTRNRPAASRSAERPNCGVRQRSCRNAASSACAWVSMIMGQNQPPRRRLRDTLRSFRPSRTQFFTELLLLPAIVPVILTSWKTWQTKRASVGLDRLGLKGFEGASSTPSVRSPSSPAPPAPAGRRQACWRARGGRPPGADRCPACASPPRRGTLDPS